MSARLWMLKILDGLLTLLGEIVLFFGMYSFISAREFGLVGFGLFLVLLGQLAGVNAIRYEDGKKLVLFYGEMLENIGRQFAYPLFIFVIYLMSKSQLLLALAFTFTLVALIKSLVSVYKGKMIEGSGIIT
ncbi:MAG: hypothetical protein WC488_02835 [Candidatus Micrarchaeia archaeon]